MTVVTAAITIADRCAVRLVVGRIVVSVNGSTADNGREVECSGVSSISRYDDESRSRAAARVCRSDRALHIVPAVAHSLEEKLASRVDSKGAGRVQLGRCFFFCCFS